MFCSKECMVLDRRKNVETPCLNCSTLVYRKRSELKKSKTKNVFCSKSCSAIYNNTHKTTGTRRSKLEQVIESFIKETFPELELKCNSKTEIGSELDFYFPSLKLGIELNGIYHYEPIHGNDKLTQIQNNDRAKLRACDEKGIDLIIIPNTIKYLNKIEEQKIKQVIKEILNNRG